MNYDIVDVSDPLWVRNRELIWENYSSQAAKKSPKEDKIYYEVIKKVFMGKIVSPTDKSLEIFSPEYRPTLFACYNPYQCRENWDWLTRMGWQQLSPSTSETHVALAFKEFSNRIVLDERFLEYGWTEELRSDYFDYYYGENYDPDRVTVLEVEVPQNLSPVVLFSRLATTLCGLFVGRLDSNHLFLKKFQYLAQSVRYIDLSVFAPESILEKRRVEEMKIYWANLFLMFRDWESEYNDYKNGGHQTSKWQKIGFSQFIALPEIVEFKNKLDMLFERMSLSKDLEALREWASHQNANAYDLRSSTIGDIPYEHPRDTTDRTNSGGKINEGMDAVRKVAVTSKMEDYFLSEVNTFIRLGIQGKIKGIDSEFSDIDSYFEYRNKIQRSYSKNSIREDIIECTKLERCSFDTKCEFLFDRVYPNRVFSVSLDPFGEGEPNYINQVYRENWKQLLGVVCKSPKQYSIKTRKTGSDWEYELKLTIKCDDREYVYEYVIDSDWLDNTLFSDMQSFVQKEKYTHQLFVHCSDNSAFIGYFPEEFGSIFDSLD